MPSNRREFLTLAGAALLATRQDVIADRGAHDAYGVLVDLPGCVGCRKCEFACQQSAGFDVPAIETFDDKSVFAEQRRPGPQSWTVVNECATPSTSQKEIYAKINCFHCLEPACASACLVGALQKRQDGPVVYDATRCMGCRYCMIACPFQIPAYEYDVALSPQVRKCTFCADRIESHEGVPACVSICPRECLTFGKRADLLEIAHERLTDNPTKYVDHVYGEYEAGGTSWMFLSGVPFESLGFLTMGTDPPQRITEAIQHGVFKFFVPPLALYALLGLIMHATKDSTPGGKSSMQVQSVPQPAQAGRSKTSNRTLVLEHGGS